MGKHKDELDPIPWDKIQPHWRPGILSLRALARNFGCSTTAITKRAAAYGWGERDLKPAIQARADQLVNTAVVDGQVDTSKPPPTDAAVVEASAQAQAIVRMGHRDSAQKAHQHLRTLLANAEAAIGDPEVFGRAYDALHAPEAEVDFAALRAMAELVGSLPNQARLLRELVETLHKVVAIEREAYGLSVAGGGDNEPEVLIRDFTGRGDPDSPHSLKSNGGA